MTFQAWTVTKIVWSGPADNDELLAVTTRNFGVIYLRMNSPALTPWVVDEALSMSDEFKKLYDQEVAKFLDGLSPKLRGSFEARSNTHYQLYCDPVLILGDQPFEFYIKGGDGARRISIKPADILFVQPISREAAELACAVT